MKSKLPNLSLKNHSDSDSETNDTTKPNPKEPKPVVEPATVIIKPFPEKN